MDIKTHYYSNERRDMLPYVPTSARTVLEVGCAEGRFGRLVKETIGAEVWGIEASADAAARAAQLLDRVLTQPVEGLLDELPQRYFDCIVCNDVLEHLVDPDFVLDRFPRLLAPDGVVTASIPNVRYWPNLADLVLHGNWDYQDEGVLDRTHLRFFTRKSIEKTFKKHGYHILRLEGVRRPFSSRQYRWINLLARGRFDDCAFKQFAVVAQPRATARQRESPSQ